MKVVEEEEEREKGDWEVVGEEVWRCQWREEENEGKRRRRRRRVME